MDWFGKPGGAAYEADSEPVATPIGQRCSRCNEPIAAGDAGFLIPTLGIDDDGEVDDRVNDDDDSPVACKLSLRAIHYECHFRMVVGGLNHLKGECICCGGTAPPDPPGLTRHEAAKAATRYWHSGKEH